MPVRVLAAAVLMLEAVGLAVLLVWQLVAMSAGDTAALPTALALAVLTAVGVIALAAFSLATAREQSWGRSGGIVMQALILAVAIGELTGEQADAGKAALIALPGVVGGIVLFLAVRAARPRERGGSGRD